MKHLLYVLLIVLCPFIYSPTAIALTPSEYQQDIKQACNIIAESYIYFDVKFNESRRQFLHRCYALADLVSGQEPRQGFVSAMNTLRSWIADGHVDWKFSQDLCDRGSNKYLGVVPTWQNGRLVVGRATQNNIEVGDEIVEWNGLPAIRALKEMISCEPQATELSNYEVAARNLAMLRVCRPCRNTSDPVTIKFKKASGHIKKVVLGWRNIPRGWITHNNYLSLAAPVPKGHVTFGDNGTLIAYSISINGSPIVVVHPYNFNDWRQEDLDQIMKYVVENNPKFLVIDLKDTAGGSFEQVLYLAHALNVKKPFRFILDKIDAKTGKHVRSRADFDFITKRIKLNYVWDGSVVLFTNSICGSGCEYFARWMQLNKRGKIVGTPTNGRGGGTDDFILTNSRTTLSVPQRDRIIEGDKFSIEGNPVQPDQRNFTSSNTGSACGLFCGRIFCAL